MSYRFELREQIASEFRRIALEQIDRITLGLTEPGDRDTTIHENRKSLKRLRALLRIVRPALGEDAYKSGNAQFREIGLLFADDRDRRVLSDTAEHLQKAVPARAAKALTRITGELGTPVARQGRNGHPVETEAMERLARARKEVLRLELRPNSFAAIEAGLHKSYRRGRRLLHEVYAAPSNEGFHDLRKCVQQQWRHMALLTRAWPDLFAARVAAARKLSQILGDDHDLAVFVDYLRAQSRRSLTAADLRAIASVAAGRQQHLRHEAQPLCAQLYAERPKSFVKRIARIWYAAETLKARDDEAAAEKTARKPSARRKPPTKAKRQPPAKKTARRATSLASDQR